MEFIWIFGASGVGKRTLLEKIQEDKNDIRKRFGLMGRMNIYKFPKSAEELKNEDIDHVLIKWQWRYENEIRKLSELRPDCKHRVILLRRPFNMRLAYLREREKGKREWTEQDAWNDENSVENVIKGLKAGGFCIEEVDASHPLYKSSEVH